MTIRWVNSTDKPADMIRISLALGERLAHLQGRPDYGRSIPNYISEPIFKFFFAGASGSADEPEDLEAFGFVTFYDMPRADRKVLAVEALWFASDRLDDQLPVWSFLAKLADKMEFRLRIGKYTSPCFLSHVSAYTPYLSLLTSPEPPIRAMNTFTAVKGDSQTRISGILRVIASSVSICFDEAFGPREVNPLPGPFSNRSFIKDMWCRQPFRSQLTSVLRPCMPRMRIGEVALYSRLMRRSSGVTLKFLMRTQL